MVLFEGVVFQFPQYILYMQGKFIIINVKHILRNKKRARFLINNSLQHDSLFFNT